MRAFWCLTCSMQCGYILQIPINTLQRKLPRFGRGGCGDSLCRFTTLNYTASLLCSVPIYQFANCRSLHTTVFHSSSQYCTKFGQISVTQVVGRKKIHKFPLATGKMTLLSSHVVWIALCCQGIYWSVSSKKKIIYMLYISTFPPR